MSDGNDKIGQPQRQAEESFDFDEFEPADTFFDRPATDVLDGIAPELLSAEPVAAQAAQEQSALQGDSLEPEADLEPAHGSAPEPDIGEPLVADPALGDLGISERPDARGEPHDGPGVGDLDLGDAAARDYPATGARGRDPKLAAPAPSPIASWQRYLLTLRTLQQEEYEQELQALLAELARIAKIDLQSARPMDLASLDLMIGIDRAGLLKDIAPNAYLATDEHIKRFDSAALLCEAGYPDDERLSALRDDVQVMMAFDDAFASAERVPLVQRLRNAKSNVLQALGSQSGQLALASVSFAIAAGIGSGVGLPIAAAMYAVKLMENEKVQQLMSTVHQNIDSALINMGFKEAAVEQRKLALGDRLSAMTSSRWWKMARLPLAAVMICAGGVGVASASGFSLQGALSALSAVQDSASTAVVDALSSEALASLASADAGAALEGARQSAQGVLQSTTSALGFAWELALSAAPEALALPESTVYELRHGDNLWSLAREHYQSISGNAPSDRQIIAMINGLGLENPNLIGVGTEVSFPCDLSAYHSAPGVSADWLGHDAPIELGAADLPLSANPEHLKGIYSAHSIAERAGTDIERLARLNPGVNLNNLMPGDVLSLPGYPGNAYQVPSLKDAIIASYGESAPADLINRDALYKEVRALNKDISLREGVFGNRALGLDIATSQWIRMPEIDLSSLAPQAEGVAEVKGRGIGELKRDLLRAAYPEGVPRLLNRDAFFAAVELANADLDWVGRGTGYEGDFKIPTLDQIRDALQQSAAPNELAEHRLDLPSQMSL